ncbi:MAG: hypothetical protein ACRCV0_05035 [Brevinema sp.]
MKKIAIIFVILITPLNHLFANDQTTQTKKESHPYYFGVLQRFGGISRISGAAPEIRVPVATSIIELKIPFYKLNSYFYTQFRVTVPLLYSDKPFALLLPVINMEALRVGGGFGFGGYLVDRRIEGRGTGWALSMNGAIIIESGISSKAIPDLLSKIIASNSLENKLINVGIEFNMRLSYTIVPHINLILGADIGYLYAVGSGDPFYIGAQKTIASYHTLTYGLTFGIGF